MTSVSFDLNVTITTETQNKIRKETFETVEFRFTTKAARALERAAGTGISWLLVRGQNVEALVLLVCYGLQHAYPKMTEDKAVQIIDAFVEAGGNTKELSEAVTKALNESGVYGRPEKDDEPGGDGPLETTTDKETTKVTEMTAIG